MRDVTTPQWSWPTSGKVLELRFEVHRHFCKTLSVFTLCEWCRFHIFFVRRRDPHINRMQTVSECFFLSRKRIRFACQNDFPKCIYGSSWNTN